MRAGFADVRTSKAGGPAGRTFVPTRSSTRWPEYGFSRVHFVRADRLCRGAVARPARRGDDAAAGIPGVGAFTGLDTPTAIEFAPNGRVFVAEKSGIIKTYPSVADTTATQVADLRTQVHNYWDRGLLGLAVDPNYPTNPYIYVYYVLRRRARRHGAALGHRRARPPTTARTRRAATPTAASSAGASPGSRSRARSRAARSSSLVTDWCYQYPSHTGGGLEFGADGYLYHSTARGRLDFADYGQNGHPLEPVQRPARRRGAPSRPPTAEGGRLRAQDFRTSGDPLGLNGAVIRIDPATGAGAPGNPLVRKPGPEHPPDRRIRPAQLVPDGDQPRHE